jgi:hypothetical protein
MTCPTCGCTLRKLQIPYEDKMKAVCEKLNIDHDMIARGILDSNEEYKKERADIVNELAKNICCKIYLMTYVPIVKLVK